MGDKATYSKYRGPDFIRAPHASGAPGEGPDDQAQMSPRGPDYSDIAESTASAMAAPLGKSFGKQLYQKMQSRMSKKKNVKMADKAPKINLRKEYKD